MGWADDLTGQVRRATRLGLNSCGRQWVGFLRWKVGTWVRYAPGFGLIRSDPGEPPFREFSFLWKSFKYKVDPKATTTADLHVFIDPEVFLSSPSGYDYSMDLEYGRPSTNLDARPYWNPTKKEIEPHLQDWFLREFAEQMARAGDAAPFEASEGAADFPAGGDSAMPE
jgi:hypothetical protein